MSKGMEEHLTREKDSSSLYLLNFFVELLEPVPIPDGTSYSFQLDEEMADKKAYPLFRDHGGIIRSPHPGWYVATFRFFHVSLPQSDYYKATDAVIERVLARKSAPLAEREHEPLSGIHTVVQAMIASTGLDQNEVSKAFDTCEKYLQLFLDAFSLAMRLPRTPFTRERLNLAMVYAVRDLHDVDGWENDLRLVILNTNVPPRIMGTSLPAVDFDRLNTLISNLRVGHPFTNMSLLSSAARRDAQVLGDLREAVVKAQIAAETFLDGVLMTMLWEEGISPKVAAETIFSEGLGKRVRTHYAPRLRGNWTNSEAINAWKRDLVRLRGRVVHAGHMPTREEAFRALQALSGLDEFVRNRLVASRKTYKRTTLLLLGQPGLERLNAWNGEIRKFVEEKAGTEPDWRVSFNEWRSQLNDLRAEEWS